MGQGGGVGQGGGAGLNTQVEVTEGGERLGWKAD